RAVARCGGAGAGGVRRHRGRIRGISRASHCPPLYLGAHVSHAWRHPPPHMGHGEGSRPQIRRMGSDGGAPGLRRALALPLGRHPAQGTWGMTSFRTPLGRVLGLGSAKSGVHHWWVERVTALAGVPLVLFLVGFIVATAGGGYQAVVTAIRHPVVAVALVLA